MASDGTPLAVSTIFEYMLWLVWTLLSLCPSPLKNPIYGVLIATQVILEKVFEDAGVYFAPNLLDVVQSDHPPRLAFFKSLPADTRGYWRVHLLVLK